MQEAQKTKQILFKLSDMCFLFCFPFVSSPFGFLLKAANTWIVFSSNKGVE